MPFTSISRNLAPFGKLSWKVITQKCLFQSSAPRGRGLSIQQLEIFLGAGSGKWHSGDVACASKKSTIVISFEGLNGKALKEAGR
jgi:hypothetical protein